MKDPPGTPHYCPALKALSIKLGSMICHCGSSNSCNKLDAKLKKKMVALKRSSSGHNNFKSMNSILMRFPQLREGLENITNVFERYDEDSNGVIDREELKKCLEHLQLDLTEKEVTELFHSCDIDGSEGIQLNEFIVLLCLIYLLLESSSSPPNKSKTGSPQLEATFDTIVEAFLFLDKNGDGKLNKKEVIKALNEASPGERSPAHITTTRFKEMDWDKNGKVSFREFLFAFVDWVGINEDETPVE